MEEKYRLRLNRTKSSTVVFRSLGSHNGFKETLGHVVELRFSVMPLGDDSQPPACV